MSEIQPRETVLRFEPFELDLERAELRKNGRKVKLAPQPFQVLALLASRGDRVVTREELKDELWGGDTFVDFEHGINTCIKQIRQALGDDPVNPRYIATVPKRGYHFIAGAGSAAVPWPDAPPRRRYPVALAILSLIVAFAGWTLYRPSRKDGLVLRTTITTDALVGDMAFSPDGSSLVYLAAEHPTEMSGRRLMLRRLDEADARALPGTIGSFNPFFFPDGESITDREF